MTPRTLTSILLDDDAAIVAQAVADLLAASREQEEASSPAAAPDPSPFVRIREAIAAFQERHTGGAWPNYASRSTVRVIATEANAPRDVVRHMLRYPTNTLGLQR